MSAEMSRLKGNTLVEQAEKTQIFQLKQQVIEYQFEVCCLRLKYQISQINDLNQELPSCLKNLKEQQIFQDLPMCTLVLCYPFSQECFIYHALEHGLGHNTIAQIRQNLLTLSSHRNIAGQVTTVQIGLHIADLLLVGQDMMVWRVYLDVKEEHQIRQPLLDLLDESIQQGFQARDQQKRQIQAVLQKERKAFSADLHDSIAQILGFLRLKSAQLSQQCKQLKQPCLTEQAEEVANYTHYAYQQVRELISASRLAYQELDFIVALRTVVQEFEKQSSIVFQLDQRIHHANIQPLQSVQILYIVRESLSNIVRHSHASHAKISLEIKNNKLVLKMSDNGQGIRRELKRKDSFGLEIMQERAARVDAHLKIYPAQPQGTCVELNVPLNLRNNYDEN
jgi:nitrate/nitrite-specific signal transduction histidine kinase